MITGNRRMGSPGNYGKIITDNKTEVQKLEITVYCHVCKASTIYQTVEASNCLQDGDEIECTKCGNIYVVELIGAENYDEFY